jgi:hypothetical protein
MLANDAIDLVESAVIKRTVSYERAFSLHIEVAVSIQRSSGLSHTLRLCTSFHHRICLERGSGEEETQVSCRRNEF